MQRKTSEIAVIETNKDDTDVAIDVAFDGQQIASQSKNAEINDQDPKSERKSQGP